MASIEDSTERSSGISQAIRLQEGSLDAWRDLVDLYGPLVNSWCRQAGLAEPARADVGQEVFLSVHRGIAGFDPSHPRATFRGWLWTITRNAILQWLRRVEPEAIGGSTVQAKLGEIPDEFLSDIGSESLAADTPTSANETAALLRRALLQIRPTVEPQTWNAFWNTAVLGQSTADVAAELGLTPASVRQAKSRMLRRLR